MPVQQFGELLRSPSKLKKHILLVTLSALILAALAAAFLDQRLSLFFNHEDIRTHWRPIARVVTDIGLSDYYFVIAILTWVLARWVLPRVGSLKKYSAKIDYARRWGLSLLVALLVSGVLTHLIKATVGRQRPHKTPGFDPFVFDPLTTHWHWHSFSSGHSQVLFTAATMFSIAFPKLRWLWFTIAIIGCATRIVVHDHFLSDTIFGACVGYVGTLLALRLMIKKTPNSLH